MMNHVVNVIPKCTIITAIASFKPSCMEINGRVGTTGDAEKREKLQ